MKKITLSFVCALALVARAEESVVLVDGKRVATVILAANAEESSKLAACELTNYVCKVTGVAPAVRRSGADRPTDAQPSNAKFQPAVYIGTVTNFPVAVPPEAKAALAKTQSYEASWTGVRDGSLYIVGVEEVADLYATYRFLADKLGIIWFKPARADDPGDYVPKCTRLVIEQRDTFCEPRFRERNFNMVGSHNEIPAYNAQAWAVRNGYRIDCPGRWWPKEREYHRGLYDFYAPRSNKRRSNLGGGHCIFMDAWAPKEKNFREHPEYFALVDGKRTLGNQYCYSNTNLLNLAADGAIRKLDQYGGLGQYCFALWDSSTGQCECEKCVAMATEYERARNIESSRFHRFVNVMADRIYARYPAANLRYLAYWTYARPAAPEIPHDPRMDVQYCMMRRCYGHAFDDPKCARNAQLRREIAAWTKIAPRVYTYEYFSATPDHYCCSELTFAHDLKVYAQMGLVGWKEEALFEDATFAGCRSEAARQRTADTMTSIWQRYYLGGKLSWDPSLDAEKLLADAEAKYYGVAYPAMREYQACRRRLWDASPNCLGFPTGDQRTPTLLRDGGARERLFALLAEAERLAKDDPVALARVRLDRRWLEDYWVKPCEMLKKTSGRTLHAYRVPAGAVTVDGEAKEAVWREADVTDDFFKPIFSQDEGHVRIPTELWTRVSVCHDGANFYLLVEAKEPNVGALRTNAGKDLNVWGDDSIELFLCPPSMDTKYYHVAVNARGDVYDARCPGDEAAYDLGVEAKAKVAEGKYVIELRIPSAKMYALSPGDTWRFHATRSRMIKDKLSGAGDNWTLSGVRHHDTVAYRGLVIEDAGRPKPPPAEKVAGTWCSLGTSITWYNDAVDCSQGRFTRGYQSRVWDVLKFDGFVNAGGSGWVVANQLGAVPKADWYTIEHGINDWGHSTPVGTLADYVNGTSNGTFAANYRLLMDKIRRVNPQAKIILCTPRRGCGFGTYLPPHSTDVKGGIYLEAYAKIVREIAAHEKCAVADFFATGGEDYELPGLSIDVSLHPNDPGYQRMADELVRAFRKCMK